MRVLTYKYLTSTVSERNGGREGDAWEKKQFLLHKSRGGLAAQATHSQMTAGYYICLDVFTFMDLADAFIQSNIQCF